jgi:poly(A) polymerase Pap1
MHKWVGLVQNKLRILTLALEKIENLSFRPLPKLFENSENNTKTIVIGLKYKSKEKSSKNNESEKGTVDEEQKGPAKNGFSGSSKRSQGNFATI